MVFLYNHMGATPFDSRTSSRYWMTGLVAAGAVMVLYTTANWFAARIRGLRYASYDPPPWWQVWLLCVVPLGVGIPAITMSVNWPTLPPAGAAACTVAALIGLGLALAPGRLAAQRPAELGWLALGGMGLMPALLLLRTPELPESRPGEQCDCLAARGRRCCRWRDLVRIGQRIANLAPPAHGRGAALREWAGPELCAYAARPLLAAHAA